MEENDIRRHMPRFQPENFDHNLELVKQVEQVAKRKGCTAGQAAVAWVAQQSEGAEAPVLPIPGASSVARLNENLNLVGLTSEELRAIDGILASAEVKGGRYPAQFEQWLNV